MVNSAVLLGGGTAQVVEDDLLPFKTGLSALAQLKQDKIHRGIRLMAHKAQPLGFQIDLRTPDDQLGGRWTRKKSPPYFSAQAAALNRSAGEQASSRRARAAVRLAGPPEK